MSEFHLNLDTIPEENKLKFLLKTCENLCADDSLTVESENSLDFYFLKIKEFHEEKLSLRKGFLNSKNIIYVLCAQDQNNCCGCSLK